MKAQHLLLASAVSALVFLAGEKPPLLDEATGVQQAAAQQMGRQPWSFSRNPSLFAQFQHLRDTSRNNGTRVYQNVTTYNSSSTSIGNYTEIEQILSGNAQGSLDYIAEQTSTGNQGSDASTDVTVDNSVAQAKGKGAQASNSGESTNNGSASSN